MIAAAARDQLISGLLKLGKAMCEHSPACAIKMHIVEMPIDVLWMESGN
jgi:hypothetical protein